MRLMPIGPAMKSLIRSMQLSSIIAKRASASGCVLGGFESDCDRSRDKRGNVISLIDAHHPNTIYRRTFGVTALEFYRDRKFAVLAQKWSSPVTSIMIQTAGNSARRVHLEECLRECLVTACADVKKRALPNTWQSSDFVVRETSSPDDLLPNPRGGIRGLVVASRSCRLPSYQHHASMALFRPEGGAAPTSPPSLPKRDDGEGTTRLTSASIAAGFIDCWRHGQEAFFSLNRFGCRLARFAGDDGDSPGRPLRLSVRPA